MSPIIIAIIVAIVLLAGGWILLYVQSEHHAQRLYDNELAKAKEAREEYLRQAERLRDEYMAKAKSDAEMLRKDKLLEVKEQFLKERAALSEEVQNRENALRAVETKLKKWEEQLSKMQDRLSKRSLEVEEQATGLKKQADFVKAKETELETLRLREQQQLEQICGLTKEQAKAQLMEHLKGEAKASAAVLTNEILDDARLRANAEAQKIVIKSIQRVATETAIENAVTVFHIDNDDIKGRIIGREGRNIRTLEAATGVEIIVDDTPEAIILSCFDPVRRELARLSLYELVQDGRIHPARIEEVVDRTRKQLEDEIMKTGERTIIDLGIHGMHPGLVRLVGKMKYRSSYGQNLLQHSRETANLCAVMASELGLDAKKARRAGLLHDIGKVSDEEPEMPHALLGMKICEKYKERPDICNAVGSHHDEVEMNTLIAPIVQVCDAISGARPGARREVAEAYIKRLKALEDLAMSYPGVVKTYAIQAGRELRVVVGADKVDDADTERLSTAIAERVQDELTYPGQIKITVIRERRAIAYAK